MIKEDQPDFLTLNDEEVLGVFGRLKDNISEIKSAANSSRNSVDRSMDVGQNLSGEPSSRNRDSRRTSQMSNRPSEALHNNRTREHRETIPEKFNNGEKHHDYERPSRKHAEKPRSRNESYSSRAGHESIVSNSSRISTRPKHLDISRSTNLAEKSRMNMDGNDNQYGSLKRQDGNRSRADSRASERSFRSSRKSKPNNAELTELYLENYHREWTLYWNMQQQLQRAQTPTYQHAFPQLQVHPQTLHSTASSSSLASMIYQSVSVPAMKPQPASLPAMTPILQQATAFNVSVNSAFQPSKPVVNSVQSQVVNFKSAVRPQKPEWRGCLRSNSKVVEVSRLGRSTTVLIKFFDIAPDKFSREMSLFPGMMLWDDTAFRDSIVDFARHMSSIASESIADANAELEVVFWDLVVHLVSRGDNSRPYEVAEILLRLTQNTGRNSVSSVRSEMVRSRDRYPESNLGQVRRHLLIGDVESAVLSAEIGECWDLALLLQTATCNSEAQNRQASELALKCLDQKIQSGDPVHTICSLACGRMPNVEVCVRDWVSNLAVVLACSTFVFHTELRLRFIRTLADALHDTFMPLARDICLIFGYPEPRFSMEPFSLIGSDDYSHSLSIPNFFMTEVFIYLAQIFHGVNLHTNVTFIKAELSYIQILIDNQMIDQAVNYCRNVILVVRDYGVTLGFEVYSQLFEVTTACITPRRPEFYEDWFQWLWNIFVTYKSKKSPASSPLEPPKNNVQLPILSTSEMFYVQDQASHPRSHSSSVSETTHDSLTNGVYNSYTHQNSVDSRRGSVSISETAFPVDNSKSHHPVDSDSRSERSRSVSITPPPLTIPQSEEVPAVPVPMFTSNGVVRPTFFTPFPVPGDSSNIVQTPLNFNSPVDSNLNTGQGNYYSEIDQVDSLTAEEKPSSDGTSTKMYDPTREFDAPPPSEIRRHQQTKENQDVLRSQNPGFSGKLFEPFVKIRKKIGATFTFKRPVQVHLPDDSKKTIYYDKDKGVWVNTAQPQDEQNAVLAPPPKMEPFSPIMSAPGNGTTAPPPNLVNNYRLGGSASSNIYNPYATIMANLQAAPQKVKPLNLSNHFVPAPAIPEE